MHQSNPAEDRERRDPLEGTAGIAAIDHGQLLHHRADRSALNKGRNQRAEEKAKVPDGSHVCAAVAELEGHAAENKTEQH
jgi:hypothetical protein